MSRRRFFVPEIRRGAAEITGTDAEHLVRVLRAQPGQIYEISDNRQVYLANIATARKAVVEFQVLEKLPHLPPRASVTLAAALIKFERFEWMIEKVTELGVTTLVAFEAARTEKGLLQAARKRKPRWEKIALEASQQSRRDHLPEIDISTGWDGIIALPRTHGLLLDESPEAEPILKVLPKEKARTDNVLIVVGPEGGWTEDERAQAIGAGLISCSLGVNVLRAETAAIAGLAIVHAAWDDSGAKKHSG